MYGHLLVMAVVNITIPFLLITWAEQSVVPLVIGLVLYVLLSAIPWIGWLVGVLVVLLALGTLWAWGRATLIHTRPTPIAGLQPA